MQDKDWVLLVIAAARETSISPVQLQKALFLLSRNLTRKQLKRASLYNFQPYDYGPFDSAVYSDATALAVGGFAKIDYGRPYRTYSATALGMRQAARLRASIDAAAAKYLDVVVAWVLRHSFGDLVRAIYRNYPEMREKSVFKN
jgi:hypothetical protein